jgi:hypothetical protein
MSLTETIFWSKIASKVLVVVLVFIVGGYYGWLYYKSLTTPPEARFAASYKCGALPELNIVAQPGVSYGNATISIQAVKSTLPLVPIISYVYKIDVTGETFETRDKAYRLATQLGFDKDAVVKEPGSTTYTWNDRKRMAQLKVDTATLNFTYSHNDSVLPKVPNLKLPPTLFRAPDIARSYLSGIGRFTPEFASGQSFSYPVLLRNNVVTSSASIDAATLVRVDFQKSVSLLVYNQAILSPTYMLPAGGIDFESWYTSALPGEEAKKNFSAFQTRRVGQTPVTANVQVYISDQDGDPETGVHQMIYNNWNTESKPCGTYPIYTPSDALTKIALGEGKITYLKETHGDPLGTAPTKPMKEIRLYEMNYYYYESNTVQRFLQPIYVAQGEVTFEDGSRGEIAVYIPAINYEAIPKSIQNKK